MRLVDADEVMRDAKHFSAFRNALADLTDLAILLSGNPIDAVPVVRCRDCKHWDRFVGEEHRGFCFAWKVDSYDEDFCSYGERKKGE